jgi:hypothetical protein
MQSYLGELKKREIKLIKENIYSKKTEPLRAKKEKNAKINIMEVKFNMEENNTRKKK